MKKKYLAAILAVFVVCSTFAGAQESSVFNITPYDFDIFHNGNKLNLDSSVLLIDGQTYVPLRNLAEEMNMTVDWNSTEKEIVLTDNWLDIRSIFGKILFELPETAEIENYRYVKDGKEDYLKAKIYFEKSDLDYMREGLDIWTRLLNDEEVKEESEDEASLISLMHDRYDWWDISSVNDADYVYFGFKDGVEVMTITVWGLICKDEKFDGYYLYISH